jgi:hypothetical protein
VCVSIYVCMCVCVDVCYMRVKWRILPKTSRSSVMSLLFDVITYTGFAFSCSEWMGEMVALCECGVHTRLTPGE